MSKTVLDVLDERVTKIRKSREEANNKGNAKDFAEYKETCGVIAGLNLALMEIIDLSRMVREEDDD